MGTTWLYKDGHYYLIDVIREKLEYPNLKARMLEAAEEHSPWVILIEDAGVGTGLIAEFRNEGLDVVEVSATQSKEARAAIQTAKFQSNWVFFPESAPWLSDLQAELLAFPGGRHDGQVDAIVHALVYEHVEKGRVYYIYPAPPRRRRPEDWCWL